MKIIKQGKVETKTCQCEQCEAILEYYPYDVHSSYIEQINYIICPCCGKRIEWKMKEE